jgi:hypothetical protein
VYGKLLIYVESQLTKLTDYLEQNPSLKDKPFRKSRNTAPFNEPEVLLTCSKEPELNESFTM